MAHRDDETHIGTDEARGGSQEGVVRWVLIIGTLLAIVLLSIIWMTGAATQGDVEEEATASGRIDSMENDGAGTDGIVSGDLEEMDTAADNDPAETTAETIEN